MTTTTHPTHATPAARCPERPADPFEQLDACHRHVLATTEALWQAMDALARGREFTPEVLAAVADTLAVIHVAIPLHSADEEQTLFPRLRRCELFAGSPGTPMDCMEQEHVQHRELASALARGVLQRDVDAAVRAGRAIASEYAEHIAKEDEILFPLARRLLTDPAELAAMADEMHARRVAAGLRSC